MKLFQQTATCRPQNISQKAFTLIGLLVVIAIIAALMGMQKGYVVAGQMD